ncbi:MAG: type 1 glutamine amidotransferase [Anaerolineae bacterium]|nr:type 1 glutamine amidotransferase [Anaerolineae bacterium]
MHFHILQHVAFEGPGSIDDWLLSKHASVSYTRLFEAAPLPEPAEFDALVALGGPMSVNDEAVLPWLTAEKRFIAAAVQSGKPVLGICLGAQLIASALGARVYPGTHKEIGWLPVKRAQYTPQVFSFPEQATVFHWHGETFDLPEGAIRLAGSEGCINQAFQIGARTIGLQFHLETTPSNVEALISNCRDELIPARFVQSEPELRRVSPRFYSEVNNLMGQVLDYITRAF